MAKHYECTPISVLPFVAHFLKTKGADCVGTLHVNRKKSSFSYQNTKYQEQRNCWATFG
jgi:hypothetical protein